MATEPVGDLVAEERPERRERHDDDDVEAAVGGEHAGRDHDRLARHHGEECVEQRDREDRRVGP
jgi:hypothetical protein